jgi:hypothetical protein
MVCRGRAGRGLVRDVGVAQLSDELIGAVVAKVRPARASGHGAAWDALLAHEAQIREWVKADLQLTNVHGKLTRRGVVVPYRTLHRFACERCGFGRRQPTVRVADGEPGVECQLDFARLGLIPDPASGPGRRRVVHALIFTAVYSRHMFVWLSHTQTLTAVIDGCEAAWAHFGGVFRVLVPDNMSPVVADADPVNPTFTDGWLDYSQARGRRRGYERLGEVKGFGARIYVDDLGTGYSSTGHLERSARRDFSRSRRPTARTPPCTR